MMFYTRDDMALLKSLSPGIKENNQAMDVKLDLILSQMNNITLSLVNNTEAINKLVTQNDRLTNNFESMAEKANNLQKENEALNMRIKYLDGKSMRNEMKIQDLEENLDMVQWRQMRENLVINNLEENKGENCEEIALAFIKKEMKIPSEQIFSNKNPTGVIRIDVAHRMSRYRAGFNRPLVVKFTMRQAKEYIMSQARKLKGTDFSISEQLPPTMQHRRTVQVERMKRLRQTAGQDEKVFLLRDKLIKNNSVVDPEFSVDPLSLDGNYQPIPYESISHTTRLLEKNSVFLGHAYKAQNIKEAKAALAAIYQCPTTATATHNSYAYITSDEDGTPVEGYNDDGEWTAGQRLLSELKESNFENCIVIVSRWCNGSMLGPRRFELLTEAAQGALKFDA